MISSGSIEKGQMWSDMVSIKAEYPDHFRTVTMSGSSSCQRLPNRQILILFPEEKSHALALSLNKGVYISLAETFSISGCLIQVLKNLILCQNQY